MIIHLSVSVSQSTRRKLRRNRGVTVPLGGEGVYFYRACDLWGYFARSFTVKFSRVVCWEYGLAPHDRCHECVLIESYAAANRIPLHRAVQLLNEEAQNV
jgi:hypothetical protein